MMIIPMMIMRYLPDFLILLSILAEKVLYLIQSLPIFQGIKIIKTPLINVSLIYI